MSLTYLMKKSGLLIYNLFYITINIYVSHILGKKNYETHVRVFLFVCNKI